jgi:hypothetical protein
MTFGKEFTTAVEQKQIAQQDAERAKFVVEKVSDCALHGCGFGLSWSTHIVADHPFLFRPSKNDKQTSSKDIGESAAFWPMRPLLILVSCSYLACWIEERDVFARG